MNQAFHSKNAGTPTNKSVCNRPVKINLFAFILVGFVAVAAMQAFQIGTMRAEANTLNETVIGIRTEQQVLREQYFFYDSNLSYFFLL